MTESWEPKELENIALLEGVEVESIQHLLAPTNGRESLPLSVENRYIIRASPDFSHLLVTKRRKGWPDEARDRGPRKRTVGYAEEAEGYPPCRVAEHSQDGSFFGSSDEGARRCSRGGVRHAG